MRHITTIQIDISTEQPEMISQDDLQMFIRDALTDMQKKFTPSQVRVEEIKRID